MGDVFAWFTRDFLGVPFDRLSKKARALEPGQSGLVALDWLNGCRSVLMNGHLSGMIAGLTLHTKPEEVYRALIEGTAFGTRIIVDSYWSNGVPVTELAVCGGLVKDPLILQIYADVTGLPIRVAASTQAVALGSAIFGAMAAGAFETFGKAIARMTRPPVATYKPRRKAVAVYDRLFKLYRRCHDLFGRENVDIMTQLKEFKLGAQGD